jgi:hypothetical protein
MTKAVSPTLVFFKLMRGILPWECSDVLNESAQIGTFLLTFRRRSFKRGMDWYLFWAKEGPMWEKPL